MAWFAERGHSVTGIDRDIVLAKAHASGAELVCADIENDAWPLQLHGQPRQFGAVVVTNYLWRPLFPTMLRSVAPGGVLLYETFSAGNETFGRPKRPDFLLQPGELLTVCASWAVLAYESGYLSDPPRVVQRIAAICPPRATDQPLDLARCSL